MPRATKALAIDPASADYMATLAAAYARSGDFTKAVHWQEKAMTDPQLKSKNKKRLEHCLTEVLLTNDGDPHIAASSLACVAAPTSHADPTLATVGRWF